MTIFYFFALLLINFLGFMAWGILMRGLQWFVKPIIYKWEWKDINQYPIPEDEKDIYTDILITDGKRVRKECVGFIDHNKKGKPCMGLEKREITHWSHLPSPPIKMKSE